MLLLGGFGDVVTHDGGAHISSYFFSLLFSSPLSSLSRSSEHRTIHPPPGASSGEQDVEGGVIGGGADGARLGGGLTHRAQT